MGINKWLKSTKIEYEMNLSITSDVLLTAPSRWIVEDEPNHPVSSIGYF